MSTRWNDSTDRPRRPRHRRLGRVWLARTRRAPHETLRRWEAEHKPIGASPRPGRHRTRVSTDTVAMPLASAFVPLAGSR